MIRPRFAAACCVLSISIAVGRAEDTENVPSSQSQSPPLGAQPPAVALPSSAQADASTEPGAVSDLLRSNLEETIREGEKVLRSLPQARMRVVRSRLSNLRGQLKRKEREQKELQDSLGMLRADFFRRSAALKKNRGKIDESILEAREKKLEDDYELHAEFFEDELRALEQDIVAIHETMRRLEARTIVRESLRPAPLVDGSRDEASARVREIPERLHPFEIESLASTVHGRSTAPPGLLWALKGEIALARGDGDEAERYWTAALEALSPRHPARLPLLGNLAAVAYARGDYAASYRVFALRVDGRDVTSLSPDEVYTMAVLSYLNGLVDDARSYLSHADEEGRQRMASVLGSAAIDA